METLEIFQTLDTAEKNKRLEKEKERMERAEENRRCMVSTLRAIRSYKRLFPSFHLIILGLSIGITPPSLIDGAVSLRP